MSLLRTLQPSLVFHHQALLFLPPRHFFIAGFVLPTGGRRFESSSSTTTTPNTGTVRMDQTKKSNDPNQELTEEHKSQCLQADQRKGKEGEEGGHPAKQADPQKEPTRTTGIREDGPGPKD
ncbi:hypothetical protein F4778DRAFT_570049 [Xylariomycetidae sp. FL2044]|nr:hypothetical protein F4778DRAFT_570049 [Xylariomycetidae sp. FL2044]